ncbi:hypothetical protein [Bradyrhizobium sp. CCGUVB23]|uniref:hypothetical protein n=1 Tax=Bradyrhizobium sp. CCGUVB23 TaxID=2949630 RepID=UPI0020B18267|nr:hypothetical protein [Bradyrhizobium sp. CCGUVB23]MCP3460717.1 hypothetical protein [Bradyrhizobium sp. CCGUVB23]
MTSSETPVLLNSTGEQRLVGYIVVDHRTGKPIKSQGGRRVVLYQHAGTARRFKSESCHRKSEIYRCVIHPREADAVPMGYVLMRGDTPVRIGRPRDATIRLQLTAGGARVAANRNPGATVRRVYLA